MRPANGFIRALLTDQYEITMAYAYFNSGKHKDYAVFDLFFRKNPFGGEFTIFGGLEEAVAFVKDYGFSNEDVKYICSAIPRCNPAFKKWLSEVDCSEVRIWAQPEGNVVFPKVPLLRVEGPLGVCQLLESALLNLVSYPSLVATNAARMQIAAGSNKKLVEFGMRRAQGPDGAVSASRYSYLGGVDGTSNMMAGRMFDIPVSGTQAHAFISSFAGTDELESSTITDKEGKQHEFVELVQGYKRKLNLGDPNQGELASFIAYAQSFPDGFLALVDTYDTLSSGMPNFLAVALALNELGYRPVGVRLDSGDLAHLSKAVRQMYREASEKFDVEFGNLTIVASNEINEPTLRSLRQQGHEIDIFGIGTHLVTCQSQPSLGCVYKLVQIKDQPKIKLSEDTAKMTIPGRKEAYRLYGREGYPLLDLMIPVGDEAPQKGNKVLCYHPIEETKRTYVTPSSVVPLHRLVWNGKVVGDIPNLLESRTRAFEQLKSLREDHLRAVNPTPYKVSVSRNLYEFIHELWRREAPVGELQ